MAHSVNWDTTYESQPDGDAVDADTLDTLLQQFKVAIRERANDFVVDWNADPVVIKPASILRTGQILCLSPHLIVSQLDEDDVFYGDTNFTSDSDFDIAYMTIPLQKNWKVTAIDVVFDRNTNSSVVISFRKTTLATSPTEAIVSSVTVSASGIAVVSVLGSNETVNGGSVYVIKFDGSQDGRWICYGVKVTYDEV